MSSLRIRRFQSFLLSCKVQRAKKEFVIMFTQRLVVLSLIVVLLHHLCLAQLSINSGKFYPLILTENGTTPTNGFYYTVIGSSLDQDTEYQIQFTFLKHSIQQMKLVTEHLLTVSDNTISNELKCRANNKYIICTTGSRIYRVDLTGVVHFDLYKIEEGTVVDVDIGSSGVFVCKLNDLNSIRY
jgi:hypothetical protein